MMSIGRLFVRVAALTALSLAACAPVGEDGFEDESPDALEEDEEGSDSTASALSSAPRLESHFSDPNKAAAANVPADMTLLDDLIRMIEDTPDDGSIDVAIHSITVNAVANALIAAKKRGVKVRVAHNGEDFRSEDATPKGLAKALGASHRWCGNVATKNGDIGSCISGRKSSLMHSKLALFSSTKDATGKLQPWVSWFGSANLTYKTGAKTFNNTVTVYKDRHLYEDFEQKYFAKLWNEDHAPGGDFFDAGAKRGLFTSNASRVTVFASPNQTGDFVLDQLQDIVPTKKCRIRVSQAMIHGGSRRGLVARLATLRREGCKVWVAGNDIDDSMLADLKAAKIPVHENATHDKYVLVYAKLGCGNDCGQSPHRKIVLTGSHNWTTSANETNDELFVRVQNAGVYDAFQGHFASSYNSGKPR